MIDRTGKTLILMGGWTAEAEVSRASGKACYEAAIAMGWNAECLEVTRNIAADLLAIKPARIFNALHGQMGEDGNIQGLLNLLGIPYTHSGLLASSIAMSKLATKDALKPLGIRFPETLPISIKGDCITAKHNAPIILKPFNDGSSIGVVFAETDADIPPYSSWAGSPKLMAEPMIKGREITAAVLTGERGGERSSEALTVTEITQDNDFYNYQAKYEIGGSQHQIPADIPKHVFNQAMNWAKTAHDALDCRGVSRSDFRWDDEKDQLYMLEINTQPGMTETSLVPEQAAYKGINMGELVTLLLEAAQCD